MFLKLLVIFVQKTPPNLPKGLSGGMFDEIGPKNWWAHRSYCGEESFPHWLFFLLVPSSVLLLDLKFFSCREFKFVDERSDGVSMLLSFL
jgi:hypothetical protein